MRFAVVSLKRSKTGLWAARKVIPKDVRVAYGKREEKKTWPASLSPGQAKAELAEWLAPIEDRIALLRGASASTPLTLTRRQCRALAGEWYQQRTVEQEARFTDSRTVWDWDADIEAILPDDEEYEPGLTRLRPIRVVVEERDSLLNARGLRLDEQSADRLLQEMLDLYLAFLRLMQRRVAGDFGPDPVVPTLPTPEASPKQPSATKPIVSLSGLFEEFAASGTATPHTVAKWRAALDSFIRHLGHDDAARVTRSDAHAWFDSLVAGGLGATRPATSGGCLDPACNGPSGGRQSGYSHALHRYRCDAGSQRNDPGCRGAKAGRGRTVPRPFGAQPGGRQPRSAATSR